MTDVRPRGAGARGGRAPRALLPALVLALACAGCESGEAEGSRSLYELERMAFVPAGRGRLEGFSGRLAQFGVDEPLLVDRFEVTRADWLHWLPDAPASAAARLELPAWREVEGHLPAYMTRPDAELFARLRGMRLPTASEWLFAAIGVRAGRYPWGPQFQESVANTLELGLDEPTPVGSFEHGRSPFGCYDMLGNVWEWISDRAPGYGEAPFDRIGDRIGERVGERVGDQMGDAGHAATVMGGSFFYRARPIYGLPEEGETSLPVFLALTVQPEMLATDIGLRCCADARTWLRAHAAGWEGGSRVEQRLRAVGRGWGRAALAVLEELAAEPGAAPALEHLLAGARESSE